MGNVRRLLVGALLVGLLTMSACGGSSDDDSTSAGTNSTTAASAAPKEVPESLEDGTLDIFTSADYPPFSYLDKDGKTVLGLETDLLNAIGEKLEVDIEYHIGKFDTGIPGIANGRTDMMVMAMSDTAERRKQVDFIDLYKTTYRVVTHKGNSAGIDLGDDPANLDLTGLCGETAATVTSSAEEQTLDILNDKCVQAGDPPIKKLAFDVGTQEYLAIRTERAGFGLFPAANADFFLKQNDDFEALPGSFPNPQGGLTGWILPQDDRPLQDTLLRTINELIDEGAWQKLLSRWGVSENDALVPPLRNGKPVEAS